ncbi:Nodulin-like [Novymonas esmeraldas]|uniref:Nodulin-like n=1 Tax=Novymonas esmeraldas TaxID=1808958 RepID=A0AAW0EZ99_9TRYP
MAGDGGDRPPGRSYRVGLLDYTLEKAWFCQFCVGILICVNNGACFVFGIFSPYMQRGGFEYSQLQIDAVSTVGVLLSYFSMPTGFLYDRSGPTATLLAGTLLNVTGWAGMYLIFSGVFSHSAVVMAFFYGLSQLSASFYETGSVLTNLKAFSCYQGRVILIQKTFMGLGSSLVAQLYVAFFEKNFDGIAPFFAFLFLYSAFAGTLSVLYLRLPTPATRCIGINVQDADTRARGGGEPRMFALPFNIGTGILCVSVAFVLCTSLLENYVDPLSAGLRTAIGVATITLCASFTAMIFTTPSYEVNRRTAADAELHKVGGHATARADASDVVVSPDLAKEEDRCSGAVDDLSTCAEVPPADAPVTAWKSVVPARYGAIAPASTPAAAAAVQRDVDVGGGDCKNYNCNNSDSNNVENDDDDGAATRRVILNDRPMWENMRHRELWLLWFVCLGAWSAMTVVSSNSSQIYQSVAGNSFSLTVNTVFVSIYGVASALGRIVVGALYPHMQRRGIPVSAMLPLAPVLNVVGLPLFLVAPARLLFLPFFVVGLGVGFSWGSTVLIITSLFTSTNCGKHYSFLYTAGMLSPLIFNMALFGPVYDHYGALQGHKGGTCDGAVCIATPLLVCTAVNIVAAPTAYVFYTRTTQRRGIVYTR